MLLELTVENVAIIDRAALSLGPGFTALTGETGAGKSLLVDAIQLALGGRADSDLVRAGAAKGSVALLADVSRCPAVLTRCAELGVDVEDGQLAVQRDVSAEGRSTVRLNGRPAAVGVLREIGALLVDLHGQHDHQALLVPERQVEFLDSWIGDEARRALADVAEAWAAAEAARRRLAALRGSRREREQRVDMLRFQVEDIETVNPLVGETDGLLAQIERLKHAERLIMSSQAALGLVSDGESSVTDQLGAAVRELETVSLIDQTVEDILTSLREALIAVQEGARGLRAYLEGLEADPEALERAAQRLDALRRLARKYGDTDEAVLEFLARAKADLEALTGDGEDEEALAARVEEAEGVLSARATALTDLRRERAGVFAGLVQAEARQLALEKAVFSVEIEPKPVGADGADTVAFMFSANPGEPARPLSKVASGGEISRVMLAIKVASAGRAGVPTLVFDEVDSGLSGRAAAVTARKLAELARHYQVLAITHLPQIAGQADAHFRIEKAEADGRTRTDVRLLDPDERLQEVARLLAGEEVGESALANARELLARP